MIIDCWGTTIIEKSLCAFIVQRLLYKKRTRLVHTNKKMV